MKKQRHLISFLILFAGAAAAKIIPETAVPFNDVNQISGEGLFIEACNVASSNGVTIPDMITFEGYTDAERGTLEHLYVFPTSTTANNLYNTNYYKPETHMEEYQSISGLSEEEARTLFETARVGTGAAPQRTRLYFQGLDTNVTYLIQVLTVNDSTSEPMYARDRDEENYLGADDSLHAVMLVTFRGKPVASDGDFVGFTRGYGGSSELRAYQIRQLDGFTPTPAHLMAAITNGSLRIQSDDLPVSGTNILQFTPLLGSGMWSNLYSISGTSSTNWNFPLEEQGFYRIQSTY